jgi:hypothetical protein
MDLHTGASWGYDAVHVNGKVILWVDTRDISCFMFEHFEGGNSSK